MTADTPDRDPMRGPDIYDVWWVDGCHSLVRDTARFLASIGYGFDFTSFEGGRPIVPPPPILDALVEEYRQRDGPHEAEGHDCETQGCTFDDYRLVIADEIQHRWWERPA